MDAQPNIVTLTEAFSTSSRALATVSHEIAHVANLPAFNNGQHLVEALARMTTSINNLATEVTTLRTEVTTLRIEVTTLRTDFTTLRTEVTTLRTDMDSRFDSLNLRLGAESAYFPPFSDFIILMFYSSLNHSARVYNSHISSRHTPLRALRNQNNIAVAGFPENSATLMGLTGQTKSHIEKLSHQTNS